MTLRRRRAMGECEPRTQGAPITALSVRLRTQDRAAQRGAAAQGFVLKRVPTLEGLELALDDEDAHALAGAGLVPLAGLPQRRLTGCELGVLALRPHPAPPAEHDEELTRDRGMAADPAAGAQLGQADLNLAARQPRVHEPDAPEPIDHPARKLADQLQAGTP